MKINLLRTSLAVLSAASLLGHLPAQTPAPAPSSEEVLELERFKVTSGVTGEQMVLPIARPFNSVFGTDDNIVDVPRNVTIISRQQLSDISIESVLDFSKLTSSAFTTTNFGAPANASIRGQSADVFLNGVRARITSNGNGLPLDFNSVESSTSSRARPPRFRAPRCMSAATSTCSPSARISTPPRARSA
jgi:catecholate siderophore receptor